MTDDSGPDHLPGRTDGPPLVVLHGPSCAGKSRWIRVLSRHLTPIELDTIGYCSCIRCGGVVLSRCRWDRPMVRARARLVGAWARRRHDTAYDLLPRDANPNAALCQDWLLARLPADGRPRRQGWAATKGYLNLGHGPFFAALAEHLSIRVLHLLLMPRPEEHRRWIARRGMDDRRDAVLATRAAYREDDFDGVLRGDEEVGRVLEGVLRGSGSRAPEGVE